VYIEYHYFIQYCWFTACIVVRYRYTAVYSQVCLYTFRGDMQSLAAGAGSELDASMFALTATRRRRNCLANNINYVLMRSYACIMLHLHDHNETVLYCIYACGRLASTAALVASFVVTIVTPALLSWHRAVVWAAHTCGASCLGPASS
jgi:hypothetical protein